MLKFPLLQKFSILAFSLTTSLASSQSLGEGGRPGLEASGTVDDGVHRVKISLAVRRQIDSAVRRGEEICVVVGLRAQVRPGESVASRQTGFARAQSDLLSRLDPGTFRLRYRYRCSPILLLSCLSPALIEALERHPATEAIELDEQGSGALEESRAAVRADEVFQIGLRGNGRVVAVLDTGVETGHPDLEAAIIDRHHFLDQGFNKGVGAEDGYGHGTHVTGIIASRGDFVAPRGIAPESSVISVKVLNDLNIGWVSDWARGVEYVTGLHEAPNGIRVDAINMSLETHAMFKEICDSPERRVEQALQAALSDAVRIGIALFASSGNEFSLTRLPIPACFSSVFSVGSVLDTEPDVISDFTNRNIHLDLLAPGEEITSAGLDGGVATIKGTSQAVPHVTAAALLLREDEPTLTPAEILETFVYSGVPVEDPMSLLTFPRLDILAAVSTRRIPRIAGLSCSYDALEGNLLASWSPTQALDSIRVDVIHEGAPLVSATLDGNATEYTYSGGVPTFQILDVCLTPVQSGYTGFPTCCEVDIVQWSRVYIRGDCNNDRRVDIADAIRALERLFLGELPPPPCLAACDINDDGRTDITDPIFLLNGYFRGSDLPPAPYPECDFDPTADEITCEASICAG